MTSLPFTPTSSGRHARAAGRSTLLALGLLLFAGCQIIPPPAADPTRFFVLTGPGLPADSDAPRGELRLGLKAVELSPYLRSRSLIIRSGPNEVSYEDYARWAETLDAGIARVLRAQLVSAASVRRVYAHPFPFDQPRDFDVAVNVIRCEGVREGGGAVARFAATVEITESASSEVVSRKLFVAPDVPWDGEDHAALVASLSEGAGLLAREIITHLPAPGLTK